MHPPASNSERAPGEVSHNTSPLKSFAYVYQDLMATVTKSKFCFASPAKHDRLYHEWAEVRPSRGIQSWLVPVAQCGDTVGLDGQ